MSDEPSQRCPIQFQVDDVLNTPEFLQKTLQKCQKVTDHMIPLCRGGEHSLRNLVICCQSCNGRKASLTYEEWVERIEPEHRARVVRLYERRYRTPLRATG